MSREVQLARLVDEDVELHLLGAERNYQTFRVESDASYDLDIIYDIAPGGYTDPVEVATPLIEDGRNTTVLNVLDGHGVITLRDVRPEPFVVGRQKMPVAEGSRHNIDPGHAYLIQAERPSGLVVRKTCLIVDADGLEHPIDRARLLKR